MTIRMFDDQFEEDAVERIRLIMAALDGMGFTGSARSYVFEIIQSLKIGNLLAAVILSMSLMEFFARELLILQQISIQENALCAQVADPYMIVRKAIEDKDRLSFYQITKQLENGGYLKISDRKKMDELYRKVRIPIQHAIIGRITKNELVDMIGLPETGKEFEEAIENMALDNIEDVINIIAEYSE